MSIREDNLRYSPKTGARCSCKRGVQRDNCPQCEGSGWVIDFEAIRAKHTRLEQDWRMSVISWFTDKANQTKE